MMTRIALILAFAAPVSAAAIINPAKDTVGAPANDPFITYQWPLFNRGQTFMDELDDIHPVEVKLDPKISIGWRNFDRQMKRDVVIAVVDSGIDDGHAELKGVLQPGENFTTKDPVDRRFPDDDVGHGTHMTGIMAALSDNGVGVSGLSNRIKIVPLKVYDLNERPNSGLARPPLRQRLVEAMNAAIARKVDVISLSMGWPRVANHPDLEAVFKKALDAGIIIVAGAGNDHHEAQIYPCAYRGVICVGSVDLDGKLSDFSNFGGHVDLVAPGLGILSLWPAHMTSEMFGANGYEISSGTSQATAFVSASAAIVRGIFPDESRHQIRARLLAAAQKRFPEVPFGLLNLEGAIEKAPAGFVAPDFKGIEMVIVDPQSLEFELPVIIESDRPSTLKVEVDSLVDGVKLGQVRLENAGQRSYSVRGKLTSPDADNRLLYEVTVGGIRYRHKILMVLDIDKLNPLTVSAGAIDLLPSRESGKSMIRPIMNPAGNRQVGFWQTQELQEGGFGLTIWRLRDRGLVESSTRLLSVAKPVPGFGLIAHDWDMDGKLEYFFAGMNFEDEVRPVPAAGPDPVREVRYFYLDENLNLEHEMALDFESALPVYPNPKDVIAGRLNLPDGRRLLVPVFWDDAPIPRADLNPDKFAFEKNDSRKRLFFLEPIAAGGKFVLRTRTLTASAFEKFVRKALNLDATVDIDILGVKTQSQDDLAAGRLRLVFFAGRHVNGSYYELVVSDLLQPYQAANLNKLENAGADLRGGIFDEAWDISQASFGRATDLRTIYSFSSARSLVADGLSFRGQLLKIPLSGEKFISVLKTFVRGEDQISFLESTDGIRAIGRWNGRYVNSIAPIYRSTFLPGELFTQLPMPVVVGRRRLPGMMMDNSQFFSRSLSVFVLNEKGEVSAPVRHSYLVPSGCFVSRAPVWSDEGISQAVFICLESGNRPARLKVLNLQ
jgi:hypothetical protein